MQPTRTLFLSASICAILYGTGAGLAGAQSTDAGTPTHKKAVVKRTQKDDMAAQLQMLRNQVEALQRRLDAQSATEQQTKVAADQAAAQAAAASAQAASAATATQSIPAQVKTAVAAAAPKTDKIYYKAVAVSLGGFSALESVYRSANQTADIASNFNAIPYPNNSVGRTHELRVTARQSRFSVLAQGNVDPQTQLGFYGEFDFLGAAQTANSNESNSYTPRIRNMYGQIDWSDWGLHALAGQNWSLVTLQSKGISPRNEVPPPTIDAQYIPGFSWTRQPQIRLTKDFDQQLWAALSVENPQTTFYTGATAFPASVKATYNAPAGSGFNSVNTLSLNHIPDVVAKLAYEPTFLDRTIHVEAFGLYRSFYERLNYQNQNVSGGGFGAGLTVQLIPTILDFEASGLGGKGLGRYGSGQLPDTTFTAQGYLRPIKEIQALAGFTLHAGPTLDVYVFAGEEKETGQAYNLATATGVTPYGYGNPLYSNTGCGYETAPGACVGNSRFIEQATAGFWQKPYIGPYGRIQWGLQLSRTERKAFAGLGGEPVANENMVFASFRYYPF